MELGSVTLKINNQQRGEGKEKDLIIWQEAS
jgi:hypothetical protein